MVAVLSDLKLISCFQSKSTILLGKTVDICHVGTIYDTWQTEMDLFFVSTRTFKHEKCTKILSAEVVNYDKYTFSDNKLTFTVVC